MDFIDDFLPEMIGTQIQRSRLQPPGATVTLVGIDPYLHCVASRLEASGREVLMAKVLTDYGVEVTEFEKRVELITLRQYEERVGKSRFAMETGMILKDLKVDENDGSSDTRAQSCGVA